MSDLEQADPYGVLLYYKYASVPNLDELVSFYELNCNSLGLLGRVRLAPHGVNVTVGGKLSALEEHIDAVKSNALFEGTDFKLASCDQPLNDKVAKECGFTSLSVRVVEELVTFSSQPLVRSPDISFAGRHLSALEFHSVLQSAGKLLDEGSPTSSERLVLLDARNLYETRIGKFHKPGVETLDPQIRQYSDLHDWIDDNSERLQGKCILMYCTGGIRCEMASAYIKGKGPGFGNVYQLYGGIQRYLEQFPDGGFFKGKNFVFDHRISVGSSNANVISTCLLCSCLFDDYSARCRCASCRMLVLVCDGCQVEGSIYTCELCQKHGKCGLSTPVTENCQSEVLPREIDLKTLSSDRQDKTTGFGTSRKLRILCLHGFRQNASSFKGRTASLAKKLRNIVELVFVDAPHELRFIFRPSVIDVHSESVTEHRGPPPKEKCNKKFAWLVPPDFSAGSEADWKVADGPFDPLQYQQQTGGFDSSLAYLKSMYLRDGPFDGILGFSQGAAMAALVCARKDNLKGEMDFRFAILCSGFALNLAEFERGSINCPSLHIFGSDHGRDRQIPNEASADLAEYFENGSRVVIQHEGGHIIPTRSPHIDVVKNFLQRFL
ncbi:rhodanese-like domain-containing protein 6 isoform X1 [Rhodamnia argentea]|uniref:Rhodanese-like domain-containing protein 6 isoform X1 n=1 Tax=Rhodamnia argentea TaxID=178133 RepID=A0A8B8QIP2_9MYRT|nr:rhodanese-like domain-containing protein 6 isoform X1 [Rhodamnia argentea]